MDTETRNHYFREFSEEEIKKSGKYEKGFILGKSIIAIIFCLALVGLSASLFICCVLVDTNTVSTIDSQVAAPFMAGVYVCVAVLLISCICCLMMHKIVSSKLKKACDISADALPAPVKLPELIQMYRSCTGVIGYQSISLVDLKASLPSCSAMDMRTFWECIQFMCKHGWFRHGSVVGGMLCLAESAAEDCRREQPVADGKPVKKQDTPQQVQQGTDWAAVDHLEGWREPDEQESYDIGKFMDAEEEQKTPKYEFHSDEIIISMVITAIIAALGTYSVSGSWRILAAAAGILVDAVLGVTLYRRKKTEREIRENNKKERDSTCIRVLDCTVYEKAGDKSYCIQDASGNRCGTPYPVYDSFYKLPLELPNTLGEFTKYEEKDVLVQDCFSENGKLGMQSNAEGTSAIGKPFLLVKKEQDGKLVGSPWLFDKEKVSLFPVDEMSEWRNVRPEEKEAIMKHLDKKSKTHCILLILFMCFCLPMCGLSIAESLAGNWLEFIFYLILGLVAAVLAAYLVRNIVLNKRTMRMVADGKVKILPCHLWAGSGCTMPVIPVKEPKALKYIRDDKGNVSSRMYSFRFPREMWKAVVDWPEFPFILVKIGDGGNGRTEFLFPAV